MPGSYTDDGLHLDQILDDHYLSLLAHHQTEMEMLKEIRAMEEQIRLLKNELDYYKEVAHWSP